MSNNYFDKNILELKIEGFEGPIDLLLSLVKDQKIDILKIKILPLAEQYLEFLKKMIKKDLEIAAEYLVVGSILAFIKSRELLPKEENENEDIDDLSEKLKFQIIKLAEFQKLSKNLLLRKQLGIDFFKRGQYEIFSKKIKYKYELSLYELTKNYANVVSKEDNSKMTIAVSKLFTVEKAINNLKNSFSNFKEWNHLFSFLPKNIKDKLEIKSAYASYFVASLELAKDGYVSLKQDTDINDLQMIKNDLTM